MNNQLDADIKFNASLSKAYRNAVLVMVGLAVAHILISYFM